MSPSKRQPDKKPDTQGVARQRRLASQSLFTRRAVIAGLVAPILAFVFSFAWAVILAVGGLLVLTVGGTWAAPQPDVLFGWYVLATYGCGVSSEVLACWSVWPIPEFTRADVPRGGLTSA